MTATGEEVGQVPIMQKGEGVIALPGWANTQIVQEKIISPLHCKDTYKDMIDQTCFFCIVHKCDSYL